MSWSMLTFGTLDEGDLLGNEPLIAPSSSVYADRVNRRNGLGEHDGDVDGVTLAHRRHGPPTDRCSGHRRRKHELRIGGEGRMA